MSSFETAVKAKIVELKTELGKCESIQHFIFQITAEGRVDGEVVLTFALGRYSEEVRGDSVSAVLEEYLRRNGWSARHAPLCLPNVEAPAR